MSHVYGTTFDEQSGKQLTTDAQCLECDGRIRVEDGERVCERCGLVVDDQQIDRGPEWRTFEEETRSRVGAPRTPTRHDRGLSTTIGYGRGGTETNFSTKKQRRLRRQRRQHSRAQFNSKRERNEMYGLSEIRRLYGALDLPKSVWEQACTFFGDAQDQDLFIGRSLDAFAAGTLYAACRCVGLPRQIEAFEEHARCSLQEIRNAYRVLNTELGLEAQFRTPSDFIPKLASTASLSPAGRRRARTLAKRAEAGTVAQGARPSGVAAACVYIAAQESDDDSVTQTAIAAAAHVSPATVRSRRKSIRESITVPALD